MISHSAGKSPLSPPRGALREYAIFLGGLFMLASGITILQVAANPLIANLGAPEGAAGSQAPGRGFRHESGVTVAARLIASTPDARSLTAGRTGKH